MTSICWYILRPPYNIHMPLGARVLSVTEHNSLVYLWAHVDPGAVKENRAFIVVSMGDDLEDDVQYITSWCSEDGARVYHLFEKV